MKNWMQEVRGGLLITVLWIIGWGLGFGGIMEAFIDPEGRIGDIWPIMLAVPGLVGGIVFFALILVVNRGPSLDEMPIIRYAMCGIATGFALGLLSIPAEIGDASPGALGITVIAVILSAVAGVGTGVFFRLAAWWQSRRAAA
jgi:hypothetical protein